MNKLAYRGALLGAVVALPMAAHAEVVLTEITAAGISVGLVGAAVFAVMIGIKVFKWVRRAL